MKKNKKNDDNHKKEMLVILGIIIVIIIVIFLLAFQPIIGINTGLVEIEELAYEENYCDTNKRVAYMEYKVDGKLYVAYDIPADIFDYSRPNCDCEYSKTIIRYNKKEPNKFMSIDLGYFGDTEGKNRKAC